MLTHSGRARVYFWFKSHLLIVIVKVSNGFILINKLGDIADAVVVRVELLERLYNRLFQLVC
jgi:hypothetical protein